MAQQGNMLFKENIISKEEAIKKTKNLCSLEKMLQTTYEKVLGKDYRQVPREQRPTVTSYVEKETKRNIDESRKLSNIYERV